MLLTLLLQVDTSPSDDSSPIGALLLLLVGGFLYFTPTIAGRSHRQATSIFFLNLLLGRTVLDWVGARIWALSHPSSAPLVVQH